MATTSEVKAALDGIAQVITGSDQQRDRAKTLLLAARNQIVAIPAQFADELAEIDGYTPTGSFEEVAQDSKGRMITEGTTLKNAIEVELTALGVAF